MGPVMEIKGLDQCLRWFDDAPELSLRATNNAMREASRKTATKIRKSTPPRFRKIVKSKVSKGEDGKLYTRIGLMNKPRYIQGHQASKYKDGEGISDWFKAYWKNYGTLTHRDPNHQFKYPIKPNSHTAAKRRRNRVGQMRVNFFEKAIVGWDAEYVRNFSEALGRQIKTLAGR